MVENHQQYIEMFRKMWLIREFEEHAKNLFMKSMMRGATHMYTGEEAIAVGVCSELTREDYISSTHRGHGHCLAKGGDPKKMMAELLGKATGYCKGKGGSMHIADLDIGILGANGIVGGGIGLAAGAALACKYRGDRNVSVVFFGDGAINQGIFYETANMAGLWNLPLIFVCEQNQFAEFSYSERYFARPDISSRAIPFGFPGIEVDGNDVIAVNECAKEAIENARSGEGPSLIVAKTYRIMGHTIGDPLSYRKTGEVDLWQSEEYDPILRFRRSLVMNNILDENQAKEIEEQSRAEIDAAVAFAMESPEPEIDSLLDDVYSPVWRTK